MVSLGLFMPWRSDFGGRAVLLNKERNTMYRTDRFRNYRLVMVVVWLVLGLVTYPVQSLFAQTTEVDDAAVILQGSDEPVNEKPTVTGDNATEDPAKAQQFGQQLYLPGIQAGLSEGEADAAHHNGWHTLLYDGFEGAFPGPWAIYDNNGPNVAGSAIWGDTPNVACAGFWSAHPNDGVTPYPNNTDTWLRYGPFNLASVQGDPITAARFSFCYYLDSELTWDHFHWEYSCNGGRDWIVRKQSGFNNQFRFVTVSLNSCLGSPNVYVKFWFHSDYLVQDQGVWLDEVRIQRKY